MIVASRADGRAKPPRVWGMKGWSRVTPVEQEADGPTSPWTPAVPAGLHGPLQPIELATASVLGAMTVVLVIAGWFLPHASAITVLGAVPMGVIAYRHRPRAVIAAVFASASVGFLVAGTGVISTIVLCGLVGGLAGHAHRRRWASGGWSPPPSSSAPWSPSSPSGSCRSSPPCGS